MRGWGLLLLAKGQPKANSIHFLPLRGANFLPEGRRLPALRKTRIQGIR